MWRPSQVQHMFFCRFSSGLVWFKLTTPMSFNPWCIRYHRFRMICLDNCARLEMQHCYAKTPNQLGQAMRMPACTLHHNGGSDLVRIPSGFALPHWP